MIGVNQIDKVDDRTIGITWTDGKRQLFDSVYLRGECPCASCINEWTGEKLETSKNINDSVRPKTVKSVGRYAINIAFSDGHQTGFYTFDLLRKLGGSSAKA